MVYQCHYCKDYTQEPLIKFYDEGGEDIYVCDQVLCVHKHKKSVDKKTGRLKVYPWEQKPIKDLTKEELQRFVRYTNESLCTHGRESQEFLIKNLLGAVQDLCEIIQELMNR